MKDILKEFEDKYCAFKLCNQVSKPELDKLKNFISKAISQTREEIIKEIEKMLDNYFKGLVMIPIPELTLNKIKEELNKLKK